MATLKDRLAQLAAMDRSLERKGTPAEYCECRICKSTVRGTNGRLFCLRCNTQNRDTPRKALTQAMAKDYVNQKYNSRIFA